jgi:hypothetical protein
MGRSTFDDLLKAGKAKFAGDRKPFDQLRGLIVVFRPNFEILPGTAASARAAGAKPADASDPFKLPDMMPPDAAGD